MHHFDICNGDADGLCAVLQWRLATPHPSTLVTGLKRDIELLDRVQARPGDEVLVCDLSMQRNRNALLRLLGQGARVSYFDHHAVDDIPSHPNLQVHVDVDSQTCSSLLMDRHLEGRFRAWALVGAYGDNLTRAADALAEASGFDRSARARLRMLGEGINYNAYGDDENDQHVSAPHLYAILIRYPDPQQFLLHESVGTDLDAMRRADLEQALALAPFWSGARASVRLLPEASWSRRVIGCLANELASVERDHAHAVLKPDRHGGYVVSVRAPLSAPAGANLLCRGFGGGGRAGAAGIDHLPGAELERFVAQLRATRWGDATRA